MVLSTDEATWPIEPSSPAAQQPSSPAAQQPSSPAAQQPSSPVIGIVGHPQRGLPVNAVTADDPARTDFAVAVVTAHFASAVVARPNLHEPALYDAALTLDRTTATAVANSMLTRLR